MTGQRGMTIKLNGIFKDNMVFQWGAELRVFGCCDEASVGTETNGTVIRCEVTDEEGNVVSVGEGSFEEDGSFLIFSSSIDEPGGPFKIRISAADAVVEMNNTWAGEVWLAAGQTNMLYPLNRSEFAKFIVTKIQDTEIFYYEVPQAGFLDEAQAKAEEESQWVKIDAETAGNMSAIGYYFAREVESRIDSKIGIICCCYSSSPIDCWQSVDSLLSTREGKTILKEFERNSEELTEEEYEERSREYEHKMEVYNEALEAALKENPFLTYKEADRDVGEFPWPPPIGPKAVRHPGSFFESMVLRIAPYTLRGVLFYQGESDWEHANEYGAVLTTLIAEWREVFFDQEMPFLFCQLPMYISKEKKYMGYEDMCWPTLREQQQIVAIDVPNVYMAVIIDCGEFDNLHPSDKKTVGDRLALLAEKFVYGFDNVNAVSPYIIDARRGEGVEITFGGDYALLNLDVVYTSEESGFQVAGEDEVFFPAEASIDFDGRTVLLNCPHVVYPSKVRYAYVSYGPTPLHAQNGLTAAPFSVTIDKDLGGA